MFLTSWLDSFRSMIAPVNLGICRRPRRIGWRIAPTDASERLEDRLLLVAPSFNLQQLQYPNPFPPPNFINLQPLFNGITFPTISNTAGVSTVSINQIRDNDGNTQPIQLNVMNSNPGLFSSFNVNYTSGPIPANNNAQITYQPQAGARGSATISITAQDGGPDATLGTPGDEFSITQTFTINIDDAPTIIGPTATTLVSEDLPTQTIQLTGITPGGGLAIGTGPGEQDVQVTVAITQGATLIESASIMNFDTTAGTAELVFKAFPNAPATFSSNVTFRVTATDAGLDNVFDVPTPVNDLSTSIFVFVQLRGINDPPTVDPIVFSPVSEDSGTVFVPLSGITAGGRTPDPVTGAPEPQPLQVFAINLNNPSLATVGTAIYTSANLTGTIPITLLPNQSGTATIEVHVVDGGFDANLLTSADNLETVKTFTLVVTPVNDEPTLNAIPDLVLPKSAGNQLLTLSGISAGGGESQTLTITATSSNQALVPDLVANPGDPDALQVLFNPGGNIAKLAFRPKAGVTGVANVTVTVQDNGGTANPGDDDTVTQTFAVIVGELPTLNVEFPAANVLPAPFATVNLSEDAGLTTFNLTNVTTGTGEPLQNLRIDVTSSNTSLIPTPTITYNSQSAMGTGSATVFTPLVIDGITMSVGDRVLVRNQSSNIDNGIYEVTDTGSASTPWILSRAPDADDTVPDSEVTTGLVTLVSSGTVAGEIFNLTTGSPITINTTGLNFVAHANDHVPVRVATTTNLPGMRTSDVLTATVNGILTIDGVTVAVNDRVLVKNQGTNADNGLYVVTDTGSAVTPWELTRATDANDDTAPDTEVTSGMVVFVRAGTQADQIWELTTAGPITLNTTGLTFALHANQHSPVLVSTTANLAGVRTGMDITASPMVLPTTGTLQFTPATEGSGSSTLTITVTDGGPDVALGTTGQLTAALTAATTTVSLQDGTNFNFATPYKIRIGSEYMSVTQVAGDILTVTRGIDGTTAVAHTTSETVLLFDGFDDLSITRTIVINVAPFNDLPTMRLNGSSLDPSAVVVVEDAGLHAIALSNISDGDGTSQPLRVTIQSVNTTPANLIISPSIAYTPNSATGTFFFTTAANASGTAQIVLKLEDGGLDNDLNTATGNASITRTINLTVTPNATDAPQIDPVNPVTVAENSGQRKLSLSGLSDGDGNTQALKITAAVTAPPAPTPFDPLLIPAANLLLNFGSGDVLASTGVTFAAGTIPAGTIIDALKFTPNPQRSGKALIVITLTDAGPNGTLGDGDDVSITEDFLVTVSPIDENPSFTINAPYAGTSTASRYLADEVPLPAGPVPGTIQPITLSIISAGTNESQAMRVTATSSNTTMIPTPVVTYGGGTTASIAYTPVMGKSGDVTLTIKVEDAGIDGQIGTVSDNKFSTQQVFIRLRPFNDPPNINAISNVTVAEDFGAKIINLAGITAGPNESQHLRVTATSDNTALIPNLATKLSVTYASPASTGILTFTPEANQWGTATITVSVQDAGFDNVFGTADDSAVVTKMFTVTVTPISNDLPTVAVPTGAAATINEDGDGGNTVMLTGISDGDLNLQELRVVATSGNTTLVPHPTVFFIQDAPMLTASPPATLPGIPNQVQHTATLTFNGLAAEQSGTSTITVTVTDGGADGKLGAPATLTEAITASSTSVKLFDATPFNGLTLPYKIKIGSEILKVVSRSGNTLTVQRGQDGTTAVAHGGSVLSASVPNATATTITLANAAFLPDPALGAYQIKVGNELMTVTARSGNTLTVVRGGGAAAHAVSNLLNSIAATATTIPVLNASSLPDPSLGAYTIRIGSELLRVTARTGSNLTVQRGVEGTTAVAHVVSNLSNEITSITATTLTIVEATTLPNPVNGAYLLKIGNELVRVTGRSGSTLTVERGANGTTAATHALSHLANPILTPGAVTLTLVNGSSFPDPNGVAANFYTIKIGNELLRVTNRTGNVLDVDRGVDGTTAASHGKSVLLADISAFATTLTLADASGFLDPAIAGPYTIRIGSELLRVTARSGNSLTVQRGADGTTAVAHTAAAMEAVSEPVSEATVELLTEPVYEPVLNPDSLDNLSVTKTFTLTIANFNDLPTITDITPPTAVNEGVMTTQTVNFIGVSEGGNGTETAQTLRVAVSTDNPSAILNLNRTYTPDNANGSVSYDLAANAYGTFQVSVTVTDSGFDGLFGTPGTLAAGISQTATQITLLDASMLPSPAVATFKIRIGTELLQILARNGNVLSVQRGVDGTMAAPHTTVESVVHPSDLDNASRAKSFNVVVNNIDDAPTITATPDVVLAANVASVTKSVLLTGLSVGGNPFPDPQTLTVTASVPDEMQILNSGANLITFTPNPTDSSQGTLTFRTANLATGSETITLNISDGATTIMDDFVVWFENLPTLNNIVEGFMGNDFSIAEGAATQTVFFDGITAGGADVQNLSVSVSTNNPTLITNLMRTYTPNNMNGSLTFDLGADKFGTADITVTVRDTGANMMAGDADDGTISKTFTITVSPVNDDAPTFDAFSPVSVYEDGLTIDVPMTGINDGDNNTQAMIVRAYIENGDNLFSLLVQPEVFYASPTTTGFVRLRAVPTANTTAAISGVVKVVVEDAGPDGILFNTALNPTASADNDSFTRDLNVTFEPVNDQPTLTAIDNLIVDEDSGETTITLTGITVGTGESAVQTIASIIATSDMTSIIPNPGNLAATLSGTTATLKFTPQPNQFSPTNINMQVVPTTITVVVTDSGNTVNDGLNSVTRSFTVTVNPRNDAPTLTGITSGSYTVVPNSPNMTTDTINDVPENLAVGSEIGTLTFADIDTPTASLAFSIISGNTNGAFAISNTGVLTVANDDALDFEKTPTFTIRVKITDNSTTAPTGLFVTRDFTINLDDVAEVLTVSAANWTSSGLTLQQVGSGMNAQLHVFNTLTGVDVIPAHFTSMVTGVEITGRNSSADVLTVDYAGGEPIVGMLTFNGGVGAGDKIILRSAEIDSLQADLDTPTLLTPGGMPVGINAALMPIALDSVDIIQLPTTINTLNLNFSEQNENVTIADDGASGNGLVQLTATTAPSVIFPVQTLGNTVATTLAMGMGDDTVQVNGLDTTLSMPFEVLGQGGHDSLTGAAALTLPVSFHGGIGHDTLVGGGGNDELFGSEAGDALMAADADNDVLSGGLGADNLDGGSGGTDVDTLLETGNYHFQLTNAALGLFTVDATDTLPFDAPDSLGSDVLTEFEQASLTGGTGDNVIDAAAYTAGPVTLGGAAGKDTLLGGSGADSLSGGDGGDSLAGGAGEDTLAGGTGANLLYGGANDDSLVESLDVNALLVPTAYTYASGNLTTISAIEPVRVATTTNLAGTFSSMANTLTASTNAALTIDGVAVAMTNRVLLKSQSTATQNGVYVVTNAGSGSMAWVLTRASDADTSAEIVSGLLVFATEGMANAMTAWRLTTANPITLNTTALSFTAFTQPSNLLDSIDRARLTGSAGANKLDASTFSGPVTMIGLGGADTLWGGSGNDSLDGSGIDPMNTTHGTDAADSIVGGAGNDTIRGNVGNDVLYGFATDPTVTLGAGQTDDDFIEAGNGADTVSGGFGNNQLYGGDHIPVATTTADNDLLIESFDRNFFLANSLLAHDTNAIAASFVIPVETVRVAATTNFASTSNAGVLTATALGAVTIDGVALALNDRVLLTNQTTTSNNGIYVVTTVGNTTTAAVLVRAADADSTAEVPVGLYVFVKQGTQAGTRWTVTTSPAALNTNPLVFSQYMTATPEMTQLDSIESAKVTGGTGNNQLDARLYTNTATLLGGIGNDTLFGGTNNDSLDGGSNSDEITGGLGNDTLGGGSETLKSPVKVATAAALPAYTPSGTTVLTANAFGALVIDGVTLAAADRVLVTSEANAQYNGIYAVTTVGSATTAWKLTRTTDADSTTGSNPEVATGIAVLVQQGSKGNAGFVFVLTTTGTITLHTTALNFAAEIDVLIESGLNGSTLTNSSLTGLGTDAVSGIEMAELTGTLGNDTISGSSFSGAGGMFIDGLAGNDTLTGGAKDDTILGRLGTDKLLGNAGNDSLHGGTGNDTILGHGGKDTIAGGGDNDTILGGEGDDAISGGAGRDSLMGDGGNDSIFGDDGSADTSNDGTDTLNGGGGNDTLQGDGQDMGNDVLSGVTVPPEEMAVDGASSIDAFFGTIFNNLLMLDP